MKKTIFAFAALIIAVSMLAFMPSGQKSSEALDPVLYIFTGSSSEENDASKYIQATQSQVNQLGCDGGTMICWIEYTDDPNSNNPPFPSGFVVRNEVSVFEEKLP